MWQVPEMERRESCAGCAGHFGPAQSRGARGSSGDAGAGLDLIIFSDRPALSDRVLWLYRCIWHCARQAWMRVPVPVGVRAPCSCDRRKASRKTSRRVRLKLCDNSQAQAPWQW